eukprot:TRINITY_DN7313_c0_g1_i1.p1 TRINITY_DN7313_c0_g1~~TRINITY_DN7313_c0_g1_i1.p1  ORF type:complete len:450 (-),score=99.20 TRINITY_DN7313_c0_g1_i1:21-1247(-)
MGDLPEDTTEQDVIEGLGYLGQILEVRLKKVAGTNKVGYGFVEFRDPSSAEAAMRSRQTVKGAIVKLQSANQPKARSSSTSVTPSSPSPYGYPPSPYGYPTYPYSYPYPPGYPYMTYPPYPHPSESSTTSSSTSTAAPQTNKDRNEIKTVFVGNLSESIDDHTIFHTFRPCGEIKAIRWLNEKSGKFRGCAFIEFFNEESASAAKHLSGMILMGRPIRVEFANHQTEGEKRSLMDINAPQIARPEGCTTMFVGNLVDGVSEETIRTIFGKCGTIKEVRWLRDKKTNRFKGCAFVDYVDPSSTIDAAKINGTEINGIPIRVDYSVSKKNDKKDSRVKLEDTSTKPSEDTEDEAPTINADVEATEKTEEGTGNTNELDHEEAVDLEGDGGDAETVNSNQENEEKKTIDSN